MIRIADVRVGDPASPWHGRRVHLTIEEGRIVEVVPADAPMPGADVEGKGCWVLPGLVDVMARWGTPTSDAVENWESGARAAQQGGITRVLPAPDSYPPVVDAAAVEAWRRRGDGLPIEVDMVGSASTTADEWQMAPIGEMIAAGVRAVALGKQHVTERRLQSLMEYISAWDVPLLVFAGAWARTPPLVWEGPISAYTGLPTALADAEWHWALQVRHLSRRTGVRTILYGVTDPRVLDLQEDLFHAAVSPFHLRWDESAILEWDAHYKFHPPLRPAETVEALRRRIAEAAMLFSDHQPHLQHHKDDDYVAAAPDAIGHATFLPLLHDLFGIDQAMRLAAELGSRRPRQIFGLPSVTIDVGSAAELTFYDPTAEWRLDTTTNASRAANTPLWERPLRGRAVHILTANGLFPC